MSDWQVGDLAVCVDDGPCFCCNGRYAAHRLDVRAGRTYRVEHVLLWNSGDPKLRGIYLGLEGLSHDRFGIDGHSRRFRKIRPDERKACEPEFVTLLKRSRKTVSA